MNRHSGYFKLLATPIAGEAYIRAHPKLRRNRVTRRTDLVIDGFPRSANTYCHYAFLHANGDTYRISTHLHTPRSILKAQRLGIPRIILIRDPRDAVASLVQFLPGLSLRFGFEHYARFYGTLMGARDGAVVASFDEVRTDFGATIVQVNARYGTDFTPPSGKGAEREATLYKSGVGDRLASYQTDKPIRRSTSEVLDGLDRGQCAAMGRAVDVHNEFVGVG